MVVIYAFAFSSDALYGQLMWIEHRDFPGGPVAYFIANSSIWDQDLGTTAAMVTNWLGDGLLLYRCWIIWNLRWSVILAPALIYIGSIAMGIMTVIKSASPNSYFFKGVTVNFGVPWICLSVSMNILVTTLICTRILLVRHQAQASLGDNDMKLYTSIMAILVESSLPFSLLGVVFVVTYAMDLDISLAFANIWGVFAALSPQFIILRVALGRAWTRDIASHTGVTSMHFTRRTQRETYTSTHDMEATIVPSNPSEPSLGMKPE
ncbi:hypothetical protein PNOK_0167800 [Pyrrhoderma noxium]|uniref:Uncharacterized protein n=1 Tax=Pyrrhoderma noxium TaxID=2282107 RepID=A0A286UQ49_9AGAM|nr:hypothetical protein PNOK_0167800 [Pyrrhoderma noxium]